MEFFKIALTNGFRLNIAYSLQLIEDVSEEDMMAQPKGFLNHPAWTIGHLTTALEMCLQILGQEYSLSKEWDQVFRRKGPGDPRTPEEDQSKYPSKKELISVLKRQEKAIIAAIENSSEVLLKEPYSWKFDNYMQSKGELLHFMLNIHHSWHIGQLAEWRRMAGYDSALSKMIPSDKKI